MANQQQPKPRKKRKKTVDPNESKAEKFVRLANARVPKTLKALKQIGALGGASYDSQQDQRHAIQKALTDGLESAMRSLNKQKEEETGFTLSPPPKPQS